MGSRARAVRVRKTERHQMNDKCKCLRSLPTCTTERKLQIIVVKQLISQLQKTELR